MAGNLTLDGLRKAVKAGEIDTVLVAGVDMQGRMMGKRFHAQFFVDGGYDETHCCNYLLATDMEMETVAGYRATSWQAGYGDFPREWAAFAGHVKTGQLVTVIVGAEK